MWRRSEGGESPNGGGKTTRKEKEGGLDEYRGRMQLRSWLDRRWQLDFFFLVVGRGPWIEAYHEPNGARRGKREKWEEEAPAAIWELRDNKRERAKRGHGWPQARRKSDQERHGGKAKQEKRRNGKEEESTGKASERTEGAEKGGRPETGQLAGNARPRQKDKGPLLRNWRRVIVDGEWARR